MKQTLYKSTRSDSLPVSAAAAIVRGIAGDGGLFVPVSFPRPIEIEALVGQSFQEVAYRVMQPFLTDFCQDELRNCIENAYDRKFDTPLIAPLVKKGEVFFLELFHGPTLAFKDMALSILPHLLRTAVKKLGIEKEIVILTATSGDTGKAALEGFAGVEGTTIIVYFPEHGVSEIQKRQMVTQEGSNVHVIGIEGNFDDAQAGVKSMFSDTGLSKKMAATNLVFSSANSINIGRLIPQVAYYFYAYLQLRAAGEIKAGEEINFAVPTGNFGNILAGYYARELGLPVKTLICASNENKVLFDFFRSGTYDRNRRFVVTMSPSMDILISSNLERLLYLVSENDAAVTARLMQELAVSGSYRVSDEVKAKLKSFRAGFASEDDTARAIRDVFARDDYVIDTHTAVSWSACQKYRAESGDSTKTVIVSTASPFKFPRDVMKAIAGIDAGLDDFALVKELGKLIADGIPKAVSELEQKPVLHRTVCQIEEMKSSLEKILGI
ncbi:MAG: threonine synthase [Dethiobacter sp.]|jgi:threonine synthase|nr:threonine synthase [Dethiobacter sp.]